MSVNVVAISGNLTRDPELRATPGGTQVLAFGVAVNERVRNRQTDEWEDRPNFVDCVLFGQRAESLSRILRKGMQVTVSGRLRYSSWETDGGQRRSKLEVVADQVQLPPKGGAHEPAMTPQEAAEHVARVAAGAPPEAGVYDEDIPF